MGEERCGEGTEEEASCVEVEVELSTPAVRVECVKSCGALPAVRGAAKGGERSLKQQNRR
jgi:hypothetical protein